jgi:hypothetical protein|tara:strand:+ start:219 stop:386 length:168 start_codon:yes stop_codon:yes gene_type:complete
MESVSAELNFFNQYFEVVVGVGAVVFFSAVVWCKLGVLEEKVRMLFELFNSLKDK